MTTAISMSIVEYAKADADDILIRITAVNRGPDPALLHLLPTLWFRNTWSWNPGAARPSIRLASADAGPEFAGSRASVLGPDVAGCARRLPCACSPRMKPMRQRLFGVANDSKYCEGRHPRFRGSRRSRCGQSRSRPAPRLPSTSRRRLSPGESWVIPLRLCNRPARRPNRWARNSTPSLSSAG